MAVIGNPRSFHKKFKFIVEIDDIGHAVGSRGLSRSTAAEVPRGASGGGGGAMAERGGAAGGSRGRGAGG